MIRELSGRISEWVFSCSFVEQVSHDVMDQFLWCGDSPNGSCSIVLVVISSAVRPAMSSGAQLNCAAVFGCQHEQAQGNSRIVLALQQAWEMHLNACTAPSYCTSQWHSEIQPFHDTSSKQTYQYKTEMIFRLRLCLGKCADHFYQVDIYLTLIELAGNYGCCL